MSQCTGGNRGRVGIRGIRTVEDNLKEGCSEFSQGSSPAQSGESSSTSVTCGREFPMRLWTAAWYAASNRRVVRNGMDLLLKVHTVVDPSPSPRAC